MVKCLTFVNNIRFEDFFSSSLETTYQFPRTSWIFLLALTRKSLPFSTFYNRIFLPAIAWFIYEKLSIVMIDQKNFRSLRNWTFLIAVSFCGRNVNQNLSKYLSKFIISILPHNCPDSLIHNSLAGVPMYVGFITCYEINCVTEAKCLTTSLQYTDLFSLIFQALEADKQQWFRKTIYKPANGSRRSWSMF